jgi:hypothetical protein
VNGTREQFLDARQALPDALDNITSGLAELPFGEGLTAFLWLAQATDVIGSDGRTNILDRAINVLDDYLTPDFPNESACILLGAPDLVAVSAAYATRWSPITVGAAGENKMNPPPPVQASKFLT